MKNKTDNHQEDVLHKMLAKSLVFLFSSIPVFAIDFDYVGKEIGFQDLKYLIYFQYYLFSMFILSSLLNLQQLKYFIYFQYYLSSMFILNSLLSFFAEYTKKIIDSFEKLKEKNIKCEIIKYAIYNTVVFFIFPLPLFVIDFDYLGKKIGFHILKNVIFFHFYSCLFVINCTNINIHLPMTFKYLKKNMCCCSSNSSKLYIKKANPNAFEHPYSGLESYSENIKKF